MSNKYEKLRTDLENRALTLIEGELAEMDRAPGAFEDDLEKEGAVTNYEVRLGMAYLMLELASKLDDISSRYRLV